MQILRIVVQLLLQQVPPRAVRQDFHYSRKTKHLAEQVPLFVNLFTRVRLTLLEYITPKDAQRCFQHLKAALAHPTRASVQTFVSEGIQMNIPAQQTEEGGNWSQTVTH